MSSRVRVAVAVVAVLLAGSAVALAAAAAAGTDRGLAVLAALALTAAFWLQVALVTRGSRSGRARPWGTTGVEIRLRPWRTAASAAMLFGVAALLAEGALTFDTTPARVLCALLGLAVLVPALELTLVTARGGRVLLTPEGVRYDGWSAGATAEWSDVVGADLTSRDGRGCVVRTRPGASSYRAWRRRRLLLPLERLPMPGEIVVPRAALDDAAGLAALIDQAAEASEPQRRQLITADALTLLAARPTSGPVRADREASP